MDAKEKSTITDEQYNFLYDLRLSGKTNMFGAASYVARKFSVDLDEASRIVQVWMSEFDGRKRSAKEG